MVGAAETPSPRPALLRGEAAATRGTRQASAVWPSVPAPTGASRKASWLSPTPPRCPFHTRRLDNQRDSSRPTLAVVTTPKRLFGGLDVRPGRPTTATWRPCRCRPWSFGVDLGEAQCHPNPRTAGWRAAQANGPSAAGVRASVCGEGHPSVLGTCRSTEVTGSNAAFSSIDRGNNSSLPGDRL